MKKKMLLYMMCLTLIKTGITCHVSCASVTIATKARCRAEKASVYVQPLGLQVRSLMYSTGPFVIDPCDMRSLDTVTVQLEELLSEYVVDTLNYIHTVRDFCDKQQKWTLQRRMELKKMRDIKDQADKISLNLRKHIKNSNNKAKAFGECMWSSLTQVTANSRYQKLEKELGAVLKDTIEGLKKLEPFLDAVEKLTVTSLFVFTEQSRLPMGESSECVRSIITAARMASPLLIHFKRNAETFFLPVLSNVDVLAFHLDKYICITEQICGEMGEKSKRVLWSRDTIKCKKAQHVVRFSLNLCEDKQKMLDHLKQLTKTRMDQNMRLIFLFQKHTQDFIDIFSECHSRMQQFLSDLEENAVQLNKMKKGASISSVAGSSVGIASGVLSIVGLALSPVTAGASLVLTMTGLGLGVTSGVNSLVTGITEVAVNRHHGKNAETICKKFMDDVTKIQGCLEQASNKDSIEGLAKVDGRGAVRLVFCAGGVINGIRNMVDKASGAKLLKNEEVIVTAAKVALQEAQSGRNIPKLAADLPDIGQVAKGTPLALSKSARVGFITLNALFIGLDVLSICKNGISLAKGSQCQASQLIRSRAALWKSELEAWQKIHDSLCVGQCKFRESQKVLELPFFSTERS